MISNFASSQNLMKLVIKKSKKGKVSMDNRLKLCNSECSKSLKKCCNFGALIARNINVLNFRRNLKNIMKVISNI